MEAVHFEASSAQVELTKFFISANIDRDDAQKYARSIAICDEKADLYSLKADFDTFKHGDTKMSLWAASEDFRKEVLKEYGISRRGDQSKIVTALDMCLPSLPKPKENQYLLGFFDVRNVDRARKESEKIRLSLARAYLTVDDHDMGLLSEISYATRGTHNTVLHLAMYGEAASSTGKHTFAFLKDGTGEAYPEPDVIAEAIAAVCARNDGKERGHIECVFLNAPRGTRWLTC